MLPETTRMALKEWAVACRALDMGKQVVLLRKGGIREESVDFRVVHPQFLLYPTFEHQKPELVKPEWHGELAETVARAEKPGGITLSHFAEVTSMAEVWEQEKVDALSPHYLWSTGYAQQRLHWQPLRPLTVLLMRVYHMQPVTVPFLAEYNGCTSWVTLGQDVPLRGLRPVLSDEEYRERTDEVLRALKVTSAAR
ncbi:MAG: DUF1802 family protein [Dehalococcoidia bacterium]|nr:DUF1802 family protein [Dehalococcoidia bacterium]